ncbi:MAG: hypothetical protein FWG99_11190 [Treponema sp.]|nr:hypothetical protein [Treponema sp.]
MKKLVVLRQYLPCFFVNLGLFIVILPLFSCTARIAGPLNADGSAELSINASLEPRTAALIRGFAALSGAPMSTNVLDGANIALSMSATPGVDSVSFNNTAPATIEGTMKISKIDDFLAGGGGSFISFEQTRSGGHCIISLSLETGPEILNLLSPEITDYLTVLMAPLATGESMTRAEYLADVRAVFSNIISDEIARSRLRASITLPGIVTSARGGTFSGRRADFDIPLIDLLVLETPISYEITWGAANS